MKEAELELEDSPLFAAFANALKNAPEADPKLRKAIEKKLITETKEEKFLTSEELYQQALMTQSIGERYLLLTRFQKGDKKILAGLQKDYAPITETIDSTPLIQAKGLLHALASGMGVFNSKNERHYLKFLLKLTEQNPKIFKHTADIPGWEPLRDNYFIYGFMTLADTINQMDAFYRYIRGEALSSKEKQISLEELSANWIKENHI